MARHEYDQCPDYLECMDQVGYGDDGQWECVDCHYSGSLAINADQDEYPSYDANGVPWHIPINVDYWRTT